MSYWMQGNGGQARPWLQSAEAELNEWSKKGFVLASLRLAAVRAASGQADAAREALRTVYKSERLTSDQSHRDSLSGDLALVHALLGDAAAACRKLSRFADARTGPPPALLLRQNRLREMLDDPGCVTVSKLIAGNG